MSGMNPTRRAPFPRAPIPRLKRGTFYFAKKRNFLLCVDTRKSFQSDFHRTDQTDAVRSTMRASSWLGKTWPAQGLTECPALENLIRAEI